MDRRLAFFVLCPLMASCVTNDPISTEDRTLAYGCDDVVVIGHVRNGSYSPIKDGDDILGRGKVTATIRVRKVVKGPKLPPLIPANYVAHGEMREDRNFMLVLSRACDGTFSIQTGQLMPVRPRLAVRCE